MQTNDSYIQDKTKKEANCEDFFQASVLSSVNHSGISSRLNHDSNVVITESITMWQNHFWIVCYIVIKGKDKQSLDQRTERRKTKMDLYFISCSHYWIIDWIKVQLSGNDISMFIFSFDPSFIRLNKWLYHNRVYMLKCTSYKLCALVWLSLWKWVQW